MEAAGGLSDVAGDGVRVCGLVRLALSGSQLWPPLTVVHIFGLVSVTALTLLVLPVPYYPVHRRRIMSSER